MHNSRPRCSKDRSKQTARSMATPDPSLENLRSNSRRRPCPHRLKRTRASSPDGSVALLLSMRAPGLLWRHEDKEDHMT